MNIPNDYTLGHVGKTLITGGVSLIATLSLKGGALGLVSKGVVPFITPHLNKTFGESKINTLVADVFSNMAVFGALYALQFIATPIPFTSAFVLTAVSLTVSLLAMKTVYVTLFTFIFTTMDGNGKLEKVANFLLHPLRLVAVSGDRGDFEGRKVVRQGTQNFINEVEKTNGFTKSIIFLVGVMLAGVVSGFLYALVAYLSGGINSTIIEILSGIVVGAELTIIAGVILGFISGILLKLSSCIVNPSTLKNNWDLVQWRLKETDESSTTPLRFSDELLKQLGAENLEKLPHNLKDDAFSEIVSRIKDESDLYAFFSTCKEFVAFSKRYFTVRAEGIRKAVLRDFPSDLIVTMGGVDQFRQIPYMKMKAHCVIQESIGVQGTYSNKGDFHLPVNDLNKRVVVWGIDPIPFIAIKVRATWQDTFWKYTYNWERESVALFYRKRHEFSDESRSVWHFETHPDHATPAASWHFRAIPGPLQDQMNKLLKNLLAGNRMDVQISGFPKFKIQMVEEPV